MRPKFILTVLLISSVFLALTQSCLACTCRRLGLEDIIDDTTTIAVGRLELFDEQVVNNLDNVTYTWIWKVEVEEFLYNEKQVNYITEIYESPLPENHSRFCCSSSPISYNEYLKKNSDQSFLLVLKENEEGKLEISQNSVHLINDTLGEYWFDFAEGTSLETVKQHITKITEKVLPLEEVNNNQLEVKNRIGLQNLFILCCICSISIFFAIIALIIVTKKRKK